MHRIASEGRDEMAGCVGEGGMKVKKKVVAVLGIVVDALVQGSDFCKRSNALCFGAHWQDRGDERADAVIGGKVAARSDVVGDVNHLSSFGNVVRADKDQDGLWAQGDHILTKTNQYLCARLSADAAIDNAGPFEQFARTEPARNNRIANNNQSRRLTDQAIRFTVFVKAISGKRRRIQLVEDAL